MTKEGPGYEGVAAVRVTPARLIHFDARKRMSNHPDRGLSDRFFVDQLDQVKKLKQFLIEEKVNFYIENSIDINSLSGLRYNAAGRSPTKDEWYVLDHVYLSLIKSLHSKPDLKRRKRLQELAFYFRTLPIIFFSALVVSTGVYFELDDIFGGLPIWFYYPVWTGLLIVWPIFQGGLGACAYLGTSAIIQRRESKERNKEKDKENEPASGKIEFDFAGLTDRNFLAIRVVLGCLFGFLLGFPFARSSLDETFKILQTSSPVNVEDFVGGLVPFVVGFSTNLVLTILNRLVASIQTIFGLSGRT